MKRTLFIAALGSLPLLAQAQIPWPVTTIDLDVNNFRATKIVDGAMWYDPSSHKAACEYPKGTNKHANYAGSIWMSAYDLSGQLYTSAAMYRTGRDYWAGPLDASGAAGYAPEWERFWKVNRKDILDFQALSVKTTTTVAPVILEWPAKGNIYAKGAMGGSLSISTAMAPFVDVNSDGIYNALDGDYPDMKGDQTIWWVFNDNGPTHDATQGRPLKIEYHAMAYAYKRNTAADNMFFVEFKMHNKSTERYNNFRFGLFSDADLGCPYDDYIAFDSVHRMAIEYNAEDRDRPNGLNSYGEHPPMTGLSFIEMPGDNYPFSVMAAGSFNGFTNASSGSLRDPNIDTEYNHYIRGLNVLGKPHFEGRYIYPISKGAMQCDSSDVPTDRRYVIATGDYMFQPGTIATVALAFMATDTAGYSCPLSSFKPITDLADSAWTIYHHPPPPLSQEEVLLQRSFSIYPNPATDLLQVRLDAAPLSVRLWACAISGRKTALTFTRTGNTFYADISSLAPGMYALIYEDGQDTQAQTFIKRQ